MKKLLVAAALATTAVTTACTQHSAPEVARFENQQIQIAAQVTPGMIDAEFRLYIDGDLVIKQRSQPFGGSSQTFDGTWKSNRVMSRVTRVHNFMSQYHQIDVFIDGQLVETLTV